MSDFILYWLTFAGVNILPLSAVFFIKWKLPQRSPGTLLLTYYLSLFIIGILFMLTPLLESYVPRSLELWLSDVGEVILIMTFLIAGPGFVAVTLYILTRHWRYSKYLMYTLLTLATVFSALGLQVFFGMFYLF